MTERLYYADSYMKEFHATLLETRREGGRILALLDRTAFYPASGGQPCDTGTLGGVRVTAVEEDASGAVLHHLESDVPAGPVEGTIDWERRFDHMQQHTGQHILSQAFLRLARAQTISFHLGRDVSTIDLELQAAAPELIHEVEDRANRILFENRPVHILTVDRQQQRAMGVRKESERQGLIRVIEIEDFDRSPCGGTHVSRTGEIGVIAVLGCERYKGGVRVEFVCGGRALRVFRKEHDILQQAARLHTSHPHDLPQLTEKLLAEKAALARENSCLQERILEMEAEELCRAADKIGEITLIRRIFTGRKVEDLKVLARKLIARRGVVAILALGGPPPQVVIARSEGVPGSCHLAVKEAVARLGGKGGGRPELAQAGGMDADALEAWMGVAEAHFAPAR